MKTDFNPTPAHRRVSDWSACPACVSEHRPGHASNYVNAHQILWAFCVTHHTRWFVTRELNVGPIPDISARPHILFDGYAEVDPVDGLRFHNVLKPVT
jgi:hypothetical protein